MGLQSKLFTNLIVDRSSVCQGFD